VRLFTCTLPAVGLSDRPRSETHAHADHLTAARYLKQQLGAHVPICIGARIAQVQRAFAPVYGLLPPSLTEPTFDVLLADDAVLRLGALEVRVVPLPGHTPDHVGYVVGDAEHGAVFTGDSLFMVRSPFHPLPGALVPWAETSVYPSQPDVGSARADFPGGDAHALWRTLTRLLSFPDDYLLYVGHDYPPARAPPSSSASASAPSPAPAPRPPRACATVREQRALNAHAKDGTSAEAFVALRERRDAQLAPPRLLHPALQVNVRAGRMPDKDEEGRAWFRTPVRGPAEF
jgi:glyoxylase-like metal-dependent hydrolase (beta-lactamase superfamily II)